MFAVGWLNQRHFIFLRPAVSIKYRHIHYFCAMIRKNLLFAAGAALLFMASCQNGNNPNIAGKWQASAIEFPTQDSIMKEQMKMQEQQIDALTEVDSNLAKQFGTNDLATIKTKAKEELAKQSGEMKKRMEEAASDFAFELMKDGKAVTFNEMGNDTATWYFADNGKKLILDPFEIKKENVNPMAQPQVMIFDVLHASSDSLRLRFHQPVGQDVFINMRPSKGDSKKAETSEEKK
jgi:hypothetical protein